MEATICEVAQIDDTLAATVAPEAGPPEAGPREAGPREADRRRPKRRARGFERGALIGRYVVLGKLGAGAMGVVFAAYDPDLDRKVAIKLIELRDRERDAAQARLQREAQALAKLNHENVVGVHDVGVHDGRVFVAMEFVEGRTLGEWMKAGPGGRPHPWREVLARFEAAGRGLAAAHAAGLVHRDFKPDNVMLGDDGRVRVMDFGLARTDEVGEAEAIAASADADADADPEATARRALLSTHELEMSSSLPALQTTELTRTGALMGTPAYMAPEQFASGEVTARSDQFGFCVALYEALVGQRPFAGESLAEITLAVSTGAQREPPADVAVPSWLLRVITRGLANDPEHRFADMPELLAALRLGEARRRRAWIGVVVLVVAGVVAGALGWQRIERHRAVQACAAQGDRVDELWNAAARAQVHDALLATQAPYAEAVADKLEPWLEAQTQLWREHARAACVHAQIEGDWDEATRARASSCLDDRWIELELLIEALREADGQIVQAAIQLASELSPLEPCTDPRALADVALPDPEHPSELAQLRRELTHVALLEHAGKYDEALPLARDLRARAQELGSAPTIARALAREAALLAELGDYEEAEPVAQRAYFEAARAGAWPSAAAAATHLVHLVGTRLARAQEGLVWSEHAKLALARAGEASELREAELQIALGTLHRANGKYEEAEQAFTRALEIAEASLGPEHPRVVPGLMGLGNLYIERGEYDRAEPLLTRALEVWERNVGPEHPEVAQMLNSIGVLHYYMKHDAEAKASYERAIWIWERSLGPEHPQVATALSNLGLIYWVAEDYARARELHERAAEIRERAHDPTHPAVVSSLLNLGLVHESLGEYEEAKALYERVLAINEERFGPDSVKLSAVLHDLATVEAALDDGEQAASHLRRALPLVEEKFGRDHPEVAYVLGDLAEILSQTGAHAEAIELAERALAIRVAKNVDATERARSEWVLAVVLWDADPEHRDRARALAQQAQATLAEAGDELELEVTKWLAEHPH